MAECSVDRVEAWHLDSIAARMRKEDAAEVWAASHLLPKEAIEWGVSSSDIAATWMVDGRPEMVFGVSGAQVIVPIGIPWALGTPDATKHPIPFMRTSVAWRDACLNRYSALRNLVHDKNAPAKQYLEWLGFTLGDPFPAGPDGEPFRMFEIRR